MNSTDWTQVSFEDCKQTLRSWRDEHPRRSEECVEIWEHVLSRHPNDLGDELWPVYEQVCISAVDCTRIDVAQECLAALTQRFPTSHRVARLSGMRFEALGRYDDALKLYDSVIKMDESNSSCRKRKVAVYKSQGHIQEAIRELNDYLKKFMNDTEAWVELSQLYLDELDFVKAAYCIEELILTNPYNHLFHERLAEIKYSHGGLDNIEIAKSYFCEAAKLNIKNVRAFFGVFLCCSHLTLTGKASGQKKKDLLKLAEWAAENLLDIYRSEDDAESHLAPKIAALELMTKNLQMNADIAVQ